MNIVDENGNTIPSKQSKRIVAGIIAIVFGSFGIHKFILGYVAEGLIMIFCTCILWIVTCGLSSYAMTVIGVVEGILYLTKSDDDFVEIYQTNKRGWF